MGKKKHFGKHLTYRCPGCEATCFRPLRKEPHPCLECGHELKSFSYRVDDEIVAARSRMYENVKVG